MLNFFYCILMKQSNAKPSKLQYYYEHNTDFYQYTPQKFFKFLIYIRMINSSLIESCQTNFSVVFSFQSSLEVSSKKNTLFLKIKQNTQLRTIYDMSFSALKNKKERQNEFDSCVKRIWQNNPSQGLSPIVTWNIYIFRRNFLKSIHQYATFLWSESFQQPVLYKRFHISMFIYSFVIWKHIGQFQREWRIFKCFWKNLPGNNF